MAEIAGKIGALYATYGAGIDIANESRTLSGGVKSLVNTNVLVSKVTSDSGGDVPITESWYCTVQGELYVTGGGTDTVFVTYKYWNALTYETVTATDITFVDGGGSDDTITSDGTEFGAFAIGDIIHISGSASNNIICTLTGASEGTLTVKTDTLVAEDSGETVTIETKLIGYEKVTGEDIAFVDNDGSPDTITSVANAFGCFAIGDIITITGSADNNITCTITAVAIGTISVASGLLTGEEADTTSVTIEINLVGQVAGFFSWSFNKVGDALETTDYSDAGHRAYTAGLAGWTGSAEKHWITEEPLEWENTKLIIKFYISVDGADRYEGWGLVTGHGVTSAVDTLVNESLSFQGDSVLTYEDS